MASWGKYQMTYSRVYIRHLACSLALLSASLVSAPCVLAQSATAPICAAPITSPADEPHAPQYLTYGDCGDGDKIDVLFTYTANALAQAGSVAAITAIAQGAINNVNTELSTSGVAGLTFRMVDIRQVTYDEFAGNPQGVDHLTRLSDPSDGYMDIVHTWRDQDAADVVSLIVASGGSLNGGVGWANVYDPNSGFTVCDRQAAIDGTFTHEWGHNMGLVHQCTSFSGDYIRYAQGYLWNNSQNGQPWATAMVGDSATCPRPPGMIYIPRYSNPDLFYLGERIGIPLNQPNPTHEALAIRETHWAVANFRRSADIADCNHNGINDATDIANATSQDLNQNGRPDECEIRLYVNLNSPNDGDGSSWSAARKSLAEAMRVAELPCSYVREIWVAQGTYKADAGTGNRSLNFRLGGSVQIYGGFVGTETLLSQRNIVTHPTILSGEIGDPNSALDNTRSVVAGYDCGPGTLLDGFTITAGRADYDGGGIYLQNTNATIRNCTITGNYAGGSGGGAAGEYGGSPRFESCVLTNNTAVYAGGGIQIYQTVSPAITNCVIQSNGAAWSAAASIANTTAATMSGTQFVSNVSTTYTGAIEQSSSGATYTNCVFQSNSAATYGGAMTLSNGAVAALNGCSFTTNTAGDWGGAVAVFNPSSCTATNCTFTQNNGVYMGGGMVVAGSGTNANLTSCTFDRNSSVTGGGVSIYDSAHATLDRCVLIGNQASSVSGGIDMSYSPTAYISRTRFLGNQAAAGGGAIGTNNPLQFTAVNCEFSGNRATAAAGGGVALYLGSNLIADCTFASNTATANGAALYTFSGNFTLSNSICRNDTPTEISVLGGATATVSYCDVQGGFAGTGNISSDPLFVSRLGTDGIAGTLDDNLQLSSTSPAIDAGNNTQIPADALDLDADANTVETTPYDLLGSPRLIDTPTRPNTGVGTPPVDMGAYEYRPPCPGDLDGDRSVTLGDLAILLAHYGETGAPASHGDLNGDTKVDLSDLAMLLSNYGVTCP